jgi:hypothetical protein
MEPLNYCRQFMRYVNELLVDKTVPSDYREIYGSLARRAAEAQKFMLPEQGILLDDPRFCALESDAELRLPFDVVALEFPYRFQPRGVFKAIILAAHDNDEIVFAPVFGEPSGHWSFGEVGSLPVRGWRTDQGWRLRRHKPDLASPNMRDSSNKEARDEFLRVMCEDLLMFLNALACSNVSTETIYPRKQPKPSKAALSFDAYHVLQINGACAKGVGSGGEHRSPREHLRRGHIRRLPAGKSIWINAVIVNAGIGATIHKDYRLKESA